MENDTVEQTLSKTFQDFALEPELQSAIDELGYSSCTPIQAQAIPLVLERRDVAGLAQTGTGKTAAFLIPLMERILKAKKDMASLSEEEKEQVETRAFKDWKKNNFVLVLVPTRELAEQVLNNVVQLGAKSGLRGASVYGGTGYDKQKQLISEGVEFVIATPGRLIDLYKDHSIDLRQVRAVVFDEADRMFDMGFKDDMKYILQRISRDRQFLVFSATLNFDVLNTAYQFEAEPVEINTSRDVATAENVEDFVLHVGDSEKPTHLLALLKKHNPNQTIIFSNFKMNVERIARFLNENGFNAVGISSLLSQSQRNRVMDQFRKEGDACNILVATDVAARGLDIENVDLVINYELPMDPESYVHRIGRTGRASAKGKAFSMSGHNDVDSLMRVEEYIKRKLDVIWLEDNELDSNHKPFPREGSFNLRPVSKERPQRGGSPRGGASSKANTRGPKRERPPRSEDRRGSGNGRSEETSAKSPSTHRDKRRGRHKSRDGQKPRQPEAAGREQLAPKSFKDANKKTNGARRPSSNASSRRRPSKRDDRVKQMPPPKGLGQKVSSFFKKLFS